MPEEKRYLVVFSVSPATPARLAALFPALKESLDRLSDAPVEQLFRSIGADHFGYLIRSKLAAGQILVAIETPESRRDFVEWDQMRMPFLTGADSVAVVELGKDAACQRGFSRGLTWLQRH